MHPPGLMACALCETRRVEYIIRIIEKWRKDNGIKFKFNSQVGNTSSQICQHAAGMLANLCNVGWACVSV